MRGERRGLAVKRFAPLKGDIMVAVVELLMIGLQISGIGIDLLVFGGELGNAHEEQITPCVDWVVVADAGVFEDIPNTSL